MFAGQRNSILPRLTRAPGCDSQLLLLKQRLGFASHRRRIRRQVDHEPAAAARFRVADDITAMAACDLAHKRQAEAPAAGGFPPPGGAVERLEHPLPFGWRDPLPAVADRDPRAALAPRHGQGCSTLSTES